MSNNVAVNNSDEYLHPVPHAVFDVSEVLPKERYDIWRDSISCIFTADAHKDQRSLDFSASVDAHMFGPLMLARSNSCAHEWARDSVTMARDGMDHYMIQLFENGCMQWETETGTVDLPNKGLIVFDLAQKVQSKTTNFQNLSLIVPRDLLDNSLTKQTNQHLRVFSEKEPIAALLRDHMLSLKRLASQFNIQESIDIAPASIGLVAACLNSSVDPERKEQANGVFMAQLTIIRRYIESNLSNPGLSANWIAQNVGVSRSKLYQIFENFGGVGNYVRDRRLRRAMMSLVDNRSNHRSIYDIALASGYTSDAAFSRAFRVKFGCSPKDVRADSALMYSYKEQDRRVDRRYEQWIRHLTL